MDEIQAYTKLYGGLVCFVSHYAERIRSLREFDRIVLEAVFDNTDRTKPTKWTQTENSNSTPSN